ncbi:MAG: phosphopantetheine-binding protein [Cytophagales bacterium]|nr:phosphopantetheine-binding protein [Cytophagales bacterium]
MNSYFNKIKTILISLGVDEERISLKSDLVSDLGLSSVEVVDLMFSVESVYDIKISEGYISELRTIEALINYIKKHISPLLAEH